MNWFIEIIWAWELQPFISEDFLDSCTPPWTRVFPVDDRLPSEDWLCHIDFELTSLHSFGAQGWLGPLSQIFPALFAFLKHYSDFHDHDINDIPHSEIARYCGITFFFTGLNGWTGNHFDTSPEGEFFWPSTSASALAVSNLRALLLDWHVKTLGKMLHLDSLVHCSRSLPDNFLLHSQRLYRFHKHLFWHGSWMYHSPCVCR